MPTCWLVASSPRMSTRKRSREASCREHQAQSTPPSKMVARGHTMLHYMDFDQP